MEDPKQIKAAADKTAAHQRAVDRQQRARKEYGEYFRGHSVKELKKLKANKRWGYLAWLIDEVIREKRNGTGSTQTGS